MNRERFQRLRTSNYNDPDVYRESRPTLPVIEEWVPGDREPQTFKAPPQKKAPVRPAMPSSGQTKSPATPEFPISAFDFMDKTTPSRPSLPRYESDLFQKKTPTISVKPFSDPYFSLKSMPKPIYITADHSQIQPDPPPHDEFFQNRKIVNLDCNNFTEFLSTKDATMVLFYGPKARKSHQMASVLSEASCATKRANHAFAGVNCRLNHKFCKDKNIKKLPTVRIYYRDNCLGEVKDTDTFTALQARQVVEQSPSVDSNTLDKACD